ncbi:MAG TPA: condensation domain-containing protein [Terriglobales bacterium]|nr:condensation domain-containing protein [Terriglobales bacterium]
MKPLPPEDSNRLNTEQKRALLKRLLLEKAAGIGDYALSCGQRALWFVHKMQPESAAYNVAFTARLLRPLDVHAFELALARLVERHPALRSTFVETDGDPVQRVSMAAGGAFRQVGVSDAHISLRDQVLAEHRRPFDIRQALFRVVLFRGVDGSQVLLITLHHLVCDAISVQNLFGDLRHLYERAIHNSVGTLPPLAAQYGDFVTWQRDLLGGPQAQALSDYWAGVLTPPLPGLEFSDSARRLHDASRQCGAIPLAFDRELISGLREVARARQATLYMIMLAAFQVLLHRYSGQDDLLIVSPASGRNQPRWLGVIGYFINMLPMRSGLAGNPTFTEHLARTRDAVLGALAHQDFPFPLMIERLRTRRTTALPPIQVMFNIVASLRGSDVSRLFLEEQADDPGVPFGDTSFLPFPIPQQEDQFGLVLEALETDGMVRGNLKYSSGGPSPELAAAMAQDYGSLLARVVANPESCVRDLRLAAMEAEGTVWDVIVL